MKIYIDGNFYDEGEAKISVFDHGVLYGDGVFEGIRFYNSRVFCLEEHLERLFASAKAILLEPPFTLDELTTAVLETVRQSKLTDGYIRLMVTRGIGSLGLHPNSCSKPSLIIIAATIELYPKKLYQDGLDLITCATRRSTPAALSPQIKSLNYLNNILAKIEAVQAGCMEGIMLNEQGYVAECTGDNIFIINQEDKLITPPISDGALGGITRSVVLKLAEKIALPFEERSLTRHEIFSAKECFLTGSAAEIIPAVSLDQRKIGAGKPGEVTQKMMAEFHALTQNSGTQV